MPADEQYDVSLPANQIGPESRSGCWNRPDKFKPSYWAPNRRYYPDGSFDVVSVRIPFRNSHECHFDGLEGTTGDSARCAGCRHNKTEQSR